MPCAKVARGVANPAVIPPFATPSAPSMPFSDVIDNNPCGKLIVTFANGVQMDSHLCCLFHLQQKLGLAAVQPPYTFA